MKIQNILKTKQHALVLNARKEAFSLKLTSIESNLAQVEDTLEKYAQDLLALQTHENRLTNLMELSANKHEEWTVTRAQNTRGLIWLQ